MSESSAFSNDETISSIINEQSNRINELNKVALDMCSSIWNDNTNDDIISNAEDSNLDEVTERKEDNNRINEVTFYESATSNDEDNESTLDEETVHNSHDFEFREPILSNDRELNEEELGYANEASIYEIQLEIEEILTKIKTDQENVNSNQTVVNSVLEYCDCAIFFSNYYLQRLWTKFYELEIYADKQFEIDQDNIDVFLKKLIELLNFNGLISDYKKCKKDIENAYNIALYRQNIAITEQKLVANINAKCFEQQKMITRILKYLEDKGTNINLEIKEYIKNSSEENMRWMDEIFAIIEKNSEIDKQNRMMLKTLMEKLKEDDEHIGKLMHKNETFSEYYGIQGVIDFEDEITNIPPELIDVLQNKPVDEKEGPTCKIPSKSKEYSENNLTEADKLRDEAVNALKLMEDKLKTADELQISANSAQKTANKLYKELNILENDEGIPEDERIALKENAVREQKNAEEIQIRASCCNKEIGKHFETAVETLRNARIYLEGVQCDENCRREFKTWFVKNQHNLTALKYRMLANLYAASENKVSAYQNKTEI